MEGLRGVLALWRTLRARAAATPYDLCATLYYDPRYRLLTLPVRARRRIALSHTDRASRLIPGRHHSSEYARLLLASAPGGQKEDGERDGQFAPVRAPEGRLPPNPVPSPVAGSPGRPRVVLIPAGSRNLMRDDTLRRWPIESYVELAGLLLARGCELVLAGGPGDEWAVPHFAGLTATDCIGRLSLVESLALLDSADLVVSHDTGPLHLAAITRAAVLAIFGPTDPRVFLPQRANCRALWGGEGFACRPCYDGRDFAPCTHNGCMRQVAPAMALAEAEALLAAVREGRELPPRISVPEHTRLITAASLQSGALPRSGPAGPDSGAPSSGGRMP
jgi:heptosyltransferase-2